MKERILRIVDDIRENLNQVDGEGLDPKVLQEIMDNLNIIEDELYNDDIASYGFNEDDEY